ncbi:MAG: HD domain-containing protein [Deltaproteobacteria bacterium]
MIIPDQAGCMDLLQKYQTPHHIILHSQRVWEVAKLVADGLMRNNHEIDMHLQRASCLLHDIAKYPCIVDGKGWHDERGEKILDQEGLPSVARIVVQHVILRDGNGHSIKEEHVLYYADKRVVHDTVVSLEERFVYLEETYGVSSKAMAGLNEMKEKCFKLEKRIFRLLDFEPEDVVGLIEQIP